MLLDTDLLIMNDSSVAHAQGEVAFDNVINLGKAHRGSGKPLRLFCQFTEDLDSSADNTTIVIAIAVGTTASLGTALLTTGTLAQATCVAGYKPPQINVDLPPDCPQYIGGTYTIGTATSTAGKLMLGIIEGDQTNTDPVTLGLTS